MELSVIIPTKNGGEKFHKVLDKLIEQKTNFDYELVIIDSGSTDGTLELISERQKFINNHSLQSITLEQIPPDEFGHGKTRAYGASLAKGKYLVFMTDDALPADDGLLQKLHDTMESNPQAAGGFAKHLPYPGCNPPDMQMLEDHFAQFTERVYQVDETNWERFETDQGYASYMSFFSDNCAILRHDVYNIYPYRDVDFAEDQTWAKEILEAGYEKLYIPEAVIYHSHNFPLESYFGRYYDDFKAQYRMNGNVLCPNTYRLIRQILGDTKYNWQYISKMTDLSDSEKKDWKKYALKRNIARCRASRLAVKWFAVGKEEQKKMDEKYSNIKDR